MNEMIERVGKAMADAVALNYDNNQAIFDLYAKAAIKAMREPTEEMINAADNSDSLECGSSAYGCWQAMIDKVLEE